MKPVEKNTFYKSTFIDQAVAVKPNFPDTPYGGTDTIITIKGGTDPTYYMLSGALPTTPAYGQSELVGGYLSVYVSGVTMPLTPTLPQFELYRTKPGTRIAEGTIRPAYISGGAAGFTDALQQGTNLVVYRSAMGGDNLFKVEDFDGGDRTLGEVKMISSLGNGTVELGDAQLTHADAKKHAYDLGNLSGHRKGHALKTYFSKSSGGPVGIKPEGGNYKGVWRPIWDHRKGSKTIAWSRPFWKYKHIKSLIQFAQKTPSSSDLDAAPLASKGNTIFDEVWATNDMNNPFTSDVNNPLMMTTCELSTAKKYSGGQAFRMYHLWDYSTQSAQLQKALGIDRLIPSTTRASVYNIPRPHWGLDSYPGRAGFNSSAVPTIEMRMNISKMQYNPFLAYSGSQGFDSCTLYYPDNATTVSRADATTALGNNAKLLLGFFRCAAITWSNYKPKTNHLTLDDFLDYGLQRYYAGSGSEHIVGGIVFQKSPIDLSALGDAGNIYASTIPVTRYNPKDIDGGSTTLVGDILGYGGIGRFGMTGTGLSGTMCLAADHLYNYPPLAAGGLDDLVVRQVAVPMDSWFNMKIVYDAFAINSGHPRGGVASTTASDYYSMSAQTDIYPTGMVSSFGQDLRAAGVPMRVYFETDVVVSGQTAEVTEIANVPYLDVYFPCISGTTSGSNPASEYSFNENRETYPMHMTVWMQNYRWIDGSSDAGFETSNGVFNWGDAQGAFPSGAAIEAELFIDDIQLKNFTPAVTNCGNNSSIGSQQSFTFQSESINTPYQTLTHATTSPGASLTNVRAWALSGQATSGNLERVTQQENMVLGFDSPSQFPNGTDYDYDAWGYIMGNGFNTPLFESMNRVIPSTFVSVSGTNTNQKYLGGQFFGKHYWLNSTYAAPSQASLSGASITSIGNGADLSLGGTDVVAGNMNFMSGTTSSIPSQDGFTSKGLMRFAISSSTAFDAADTWTKRENISVSTKIIGVPAQDDVYDLADNQVRVANTQIFNKYLDDEYIIFSIGQVMPSGAPGGSAYTKGWGTSSLKLADDIDIDNSTGVVTFDGSIITSDTGADLCVPGNIVDLWLSPKKYWLNLYWPAEKVRRTYKNFAIIQNVGTDGDGNTEPTAASLSGSTWNEGVYSYKSSLRANAGEASLNIRSWDLEPSVTNTTLVSNIDYGYGTFDEEEQTGGEISQATALIDDWVPLDLTRLASGKETTPEESIIFRLGLGDPTGGETVSIYSDESTATEKKPTMYWQYKDNLPKFSAPLKVYPNYNILSGSGADKADLYKLDREQLNALKFTWEEDSDDILYRLLYIDTEPILNKYDGAWFRASVNEVPDTDSLARGYYYSGSESTGVLMGPTDGSYRVITGPAGWGYDASYDRTAINWPTTDGSISWGWFGATEATIIAHCVPNDDTTGTGEPIFSDRDNTYGTFLIDYTKGATANANVTPRVTLTSGAAGFSGKTYTLTSSYSFPNNGESPLYIVVVFNAALPQNNVKLYVNGMLCAQSAGGWVTDRALYDGTGYTGLINIGSDGPGGVGDVFRGIMSECMVHSKALHVPTEANEYILDTSYLPDMSSGTEIKYNARLFLFDYHNIIGSSTDLVASSSGVTWEATGV